MKHLVQSMTLMGRVQEVAAAEARFRLRCRSGDEFDIHVGDETQFRVLRNLDGLDRDRVPQVGDAGPTPSVKVGRYVWNGALIAVQGVYQEQDDRQRFDASHVHLFHSEPNRYLFEDTHWWLTQITRLADEWLDDLFGDRRSYGTADFAELYRTKLNILGGRTDDDVQECATLSRLIYGLSSAYLLTGQDRYIAAASAGVRYLRETFRSLSHDGKYCFWHFGKRRTDRGAHIIVASENPDDRGTIPLYEQIYALAGLAQYYRVTQEWEVLEDIRRTVDAFQDFYRDEKQYGYEGHKGYFSHLDYATMRPDAAVLGDNRLRKNWNSIGDHIPAYLVNLLIALDTKEGRESSGLFDVCEEILRVTSDLIVEKFPDENPAIPYVNERFHRDWTPDHGWGWQKNRAVVGHNFKIAWNLTRVANYSRTRAVSTRDGEARQDWSRRAERASALARKLGDAMETAGVDRLRGGCFDAVEREPGNGMPLQFGWSATKDFWQQEQAILAYLILHGCAPDGGAGGRREDYLALARELTGFWNLFFLDHDNRGYFSRVTDSGGPVVEGEYGYKSAHSTCAYHVFELNYLAHVYLRSYLDTGGGAAKIRRESGGVDCFDAVDPNFCLFFKPSAGSGRRSLNVQPDFLPPGQLEVAGVTVNGRKRNVQPDRFEIEIAEGEAGDQIMIEYRPGSRRGPVAPGTEVER